MTATDLQANLAPFWENALTQLTEKLTSPPSSLLEVERLLRDTLYEVLDLSMQPILQSMADRSGREMKALAKGAGLSKLVRRPMSMQLSTGSYVTVVGLYAQQAPSRYRGPRHMLSSLWCLTDRATPLCASNFALASVAAPSFQGASALLSHLGIKCLPERLRKVSVALGRSIGALGAKGLHAKGESLAGKRVIVGIDGGRSRMREYTGEVNAEGNPTYKGKWREPTLLVIHVLGGDGRPCPESLPIYHAGFDKEKLMAVLEEHLLALGIGSAGHVQFVGDGAPWIWNAVAALVEKLGLPKERTSLTLDYYHASTHLYGLLAALPKRLAKELPSIAKQFKDWLWEGEVGKMLQRCGELMARKSAEAAKCINYFINNKDRMGYAALRKVNLACGSGIIESGIRRVINQRFKNNGTFWLEENLEPLFLLRGAYLSSRWEIMLKNLVSAHFLYYKS